MASVTIVDVQDGVVCGDPVQLPEGADIGTYFPPEVAERMVVLSAAQAEQVRSGWHYAGDAFQAPPAPVPVLPRIITPREFRLRFTASERGALTLAASQNLLQGDPALQVFLDDLSASQAVELDHPELIAGVDAIVAAALITRARASEILAH
jgi:hypothetical protein